MLFESGLLIVRVRIDLVRISPPRHLLRSAMWIVGVDAGLGRWTPALGATGAAVVLQPSSCGGTIASWLMHNTQHTQHDGALQSDATYGNRTRFIDLRSRVPRWAATPPTWLQNPTPAFACQHLPGYRALHAQILRVAALMAMTTAVGAAEYVQLFCWVVRCGIGRAQRPKPARGLPWPWAWHVHLMYLPPICPEDLTKLLQPLVQLSNELWTRLYVHRCRHIAQGGRSSSPHDDAAAHGGRATS
jgi:hypothetical protein